MAKTVLLPANHKLVTAFENDFRLFAASMISIQNIIDETVPLLFNYPQRIMYQTYMNAVLNNLPVRIIILKARQEGLSTFSLALLLFHMLFYPGSQYRVITKDLKHVEYLMMRLKFMYNHLPPEFKPPVKIDSKKELSFPQLYSPTGVDLLGAASSIRIDTAGGKRSTPTRGETIRGALATEIPYWDNPVSVFASLKNAIHPQPGTFLIIESTALAHGDTFYNLWDQAVKGRSGYETLFFPWFIFADYRFPVTQSEVDLLKSSLDEEEKQLLLKFPCISFEHLKWRRWSIDANCDGSLATFHREYPSTPQEAFESAEANYFPVSILRYVEETLRKPIFIGRLSYRGLETEPVIAVLPGSNESVHSNTFRMWEYPNNNSKYIIGVDPAEGSPTGDFIAAEVFRVDYDHNDIPFMVQVAEMQTREGADDVIVHIHALAKYYNRAVLNVEAQGMGYAFVSTLKRRYSNMQRWKWGDSAGEASSRKLGWVINGNTKREVLNSLTTKLNKHQMIIRSFWLYTEMQNYITLNGVTGAAPGGHDDMVSAAMLAAITFDVSNCTPGRVYHQ